MVATIGKDNIALDKKKQSALTKAVKRVVKNKGSIQKKNGPSDKKGVIMLKHIPHGFYEKEMRGYFSQFGQVRRIKVARSKKTGVSRGYAFVEFEYEEVAKIAAEAMNNYLMFERLIKCEVVSDEINTNKLFKGKRIKANNYPKLKARKHVGLEQEREQSEQETDEIMKQRIAKLEEQNKKFAELGIDYQFKFSPKVLKDEKSPGPTAQPSTSTDVVKTPGKKGKTPQSKNVTPKLTLDPTPEKQKKQTPEKAKFSPKLTPKQNVNPTPERQKKKTPEKAKFSPKVTPKQKLDRIQEKLKKQTPEKSKFSPKVTPQLNLDPTSEKLTKKTPEKSNISPKLNFDPTPEKQKKKTPEKSKFSPKLNVDQTQEKQKKKTPQKNKFSPKVLRSRKSQGPNVQPTTVVTKTPGKKDKTSELPKVTPKLNLDQAQEIQKKKTPEKNKFSPKVLRSRKSQGPNVQPSTTGVAKTPGKKDKTSELPRISPKLLRSRKSDASGLTPLAAKASATPAKQKKAGRKSIL